MIKIGISGNIASGKTQAENYIKQFYPVIDSDEIAHEILNQKSEIIKKEFENFDILENNIISRRKLGNLVFNNKELRTKLENIIHPEITKETEKFFEENKNQKMAFVSIPLVYETKMEYLFDKIIFIYANDEIRLKRLMKRNNLTKDEALLRINSQMPQDDKIKKADFVIKNETDLNSLYSQLNEIIF